MARQADGQGRASEDGLTCGQEREDPPWFDEGEVGREDGEEHADAHQHPHQAPGAGREEAADQKVDDQSEPTSVGPQDDPPKAGRPRMKGKARENSSNAAPDKLE